MRIALGTTNKGKILGAESVLFAVYPHAHIAPVGVDSGVAPMPMTRAETIAGARNRARAALAAVPDADLGIGLEGGCDEVDGTLFLGGWAVIVDRDGREATGSSAWVELPRDIADALRGGAELGPLMRARLEDERNEIRESSGTHGILTQGRYSRVEEFTHALTCALAPFLNREFYPAGPRQGPPERP